MHQLAFVTFFILYSQSIFFVSSQLSPEGRNVCKREVKYNTYVSRKHSRIGYETYYVKCRFWRWSRCARSRPTTVYYYKRELTQKTRYVYYCCNGWTQLGWSRGGSGCPNAICSPSCRHGDCQSPNYCSCNSGWQGNTCYQDIDECTRRPCHQICKNQPGTYTCICKRGYIPSSPNPRVPNCKDVDECKKTPCSCARGSPSCKATCKNTIGSFHCGCNQGYKLVNGRICADINECAKGNRNECDQRCHNSIGAYTCSCNDGYRLAKDKRKCQDVNECSVLNGGCNQICRNSNGSYQCACKQGYKLTSNGKVCMDIDECQVNRPCDQLNGLCFNTLGSYYCQCKTGYSLSSNNHTCDDVDECGKKATNLCSQLCHNTKGGYFCSCRAGFNLGADNVTCEDIDECQEKTDKCQQLCYNTIGSYKCSCRQGYKMNADQLSCQGLPCQTITNPKHGSMKCLGFVTDQSCIFQCNRGYELIGSRNRTCLPTSAWSGNAPSCYRKSCSSITAPQNGGVSLPCIDHFNATCFLKCSKGYYNVGSDTVVCDVNEEGAAYWRGDNTTCQAVKSCTPNPCAHGGKCHVLTRNTFKCSCDGTGYKGTTCETGYIKVPLFPLLELGVWSKEQIYTAFPDSPLSMKILVVEGDAVVRPSSVLFTSSSRHKAIKILANKVGEIRLSYKLYGEEAPYFSVIEGSTVYAQQENKSKSPIEATQKFYESLCSSKIIGRCQNGNYINLISSCSWIDNHGRHYISLSSGQKTFPLSIAGVIAKNISSASEVISPKEDTRQFLDKQKISKCVTSSRHCKSKEYNLTSANFIKEYSLFLRGYQEALSTHVPYWYGMSTESPFDSMAVNAGFQPTDIYSQVGTENALTSLHGEEILNNNMNDLYSYYTTTRKSILRLLAIEKSIGGSSPFHLVSSLCGDYHHVRFEDGGGFNLTVDLIDMGFQELKHMFVRTLGFTNFQPNCMRIMHGMADKESCVRANTFWMAETVFQFNADNYLQLSGRTLAELNTLTEIPMTALSRTQSAIFNGSCGLRYRLMIFNRSIHLSVADKQASAYFQIGGPSDCTSCNSHGIFLKLNRTAASFTYTSSLLTLNPTSDDLHVTYLYDVVDGVVAGIDNINQLTSKLKLLNNSVHSDFRALKRVTGAKFLHDYLLIQKRGRSVMTMVRALLLKIQKGPGYREIYSGIVELKSRYLELQCAFQSLKNRLESDAVSLRVKSKLRISTLHFRRIDSLAAKPRRSKVKSTFQGNVIGYKGAFCLHKLCFENMKVMLSDRNEKYDQTCQNCKKSFRFQRGNNVSIVGKTENRVGMGDSMFMTTNTIVSIQFDESDGLPEGNFTTYVSLLRKTYLAEFRIFKDTISFTIANVEIEGNLVFNLTGRKPLSSATWNNILTSMTGEANAQLRYADAISSKMQLYFRTIAEYTGKRMKEVQSRVLLANEKRKNHSENLIRLQKLLISKTESLRTAKGMYHRQQVLLNRSQVELQSYLADISSIFIEKSLDNVCQFQVCNRSCISMPVFQLCQDPIFVPIELQECEQASEMIRTQQIEPYKTQCELRRYSFIPVYTGSCPEDPGMAAQRQATLQATLVSTGSVIGGLIGSIIPKLGTYLGAKIGAAIGFVAGLFFGCDSTYEVFTKTWTEQVDCTLIRNTVKVTKRYYSECYPVTKTVLTGYAEPRKCNFSSNPCAVVVKDPECLRQNEKCQLLRDEYVKANQSLPKPYKDAFGRVRQAQTNVQVALSDFLRLRRERAEKQRQLKEVKSLLKHSNENSRFANGSQSLLISRIPVDYCLLQHYSTSSNISDHVILQKLTIDLTLPLINNLGIAAHVVKSKTGETMAVNFIAQFQDEESSTTSAAKQILRSALCKKRRSQRSIDVSNTDPFPFTSWYIDETKNATEVQTACLTFRRITRYLEKITLSLDKIVKNHAFYSSKVTQANSVAKTFDTNLNTTERELLSQSREIVSIMADLTDLTAQATVEAVIEEWKLDAEVYTGLNNLTVCFNLKDCIHMVIETLMDLPTMLKVTRHEFHSILKNLQHVVLSILEEKKSLNELRDDVSKIKASLRLVKNVSLVCAPKPHVFMNYSEQHRVRLNTQVTMKCSLSSLLPVKYIWTKNSKILKDEVSKWLRFVALRTSNGFYECTGISLSGNGSSNGTQVIVEYSPLFLEEPEDSVYWIPSPVLIGPHFVCNGTAEPQPSIRWYYVSFDESVPRRLHTAQNLSIYVPERITSNSSGYYFCELNNSVGIRRSRMASLHVVRHYLADQLMTLSFNFSSINGKALNVTSFDKIAMQMQRNKSHSVNYTLTSHREQGRVSFSIFSQPANLVNGSNPDTFLSLAAQSRQGLANSVASFLGDVLQRGSVIYDDNGTALTVNHETFQTDFIGNICRPGYAIKANGFLCGECTAGTFDDGGKCHSCPLGFHQSFTGQTSCFQCADNKTTSSRASTGLESCVHPDLCKLGQHQCHRNAHCISVNATYQCRCFDNYTGDGLSCSRIENTPVITDTDTGLSTELIYLSAGLSGVIIIIIGIVSMIFIKRKRKQANKQKEDLPYGEFNLDFSPPSINIASVSEFDISPCSTDLVHVNENAFDPLKLELETKLKNRKHIYRGNSFTTIDT